MARRWMMTTVCGLVGIWALVGSPVATAGESFAPYLKGAWELIFYAASGGIFMVGIGGKLRLELREPRLVGFHQ